MKSFAFATLAIWAVMICVCFAAPEPAIVPAPDDWTVEISFGHPQQILVRPTAADSPKRFWYILVTLTNRSNRDVDFYPKCELMTDTFQIIPAGKSVSAAVFERIKKRHQSKYPFLEPLESVDNRILQGEDNSKDIAIMWPDFDPKAKGIKIFIAGLSNETVVVEHPVAKDQNDEPVKVFLRKTFELSYAISGDPALRSSAKLTYEGKRWVMR